MLTTYSKGRSEKAHETMTDPKALRRLPFFFFSLLNFNSPSLDFPLILALPFGAFLWHNLAFQMFPFKVTVWNWN